MTSTLSYSVSKALKIIKFILTRKSAWQRTHMHSQY